MRKWFLPGLSNGLLIVRDPIVLYIYYIALQQGINPLQNKYLKFLLNLTLVSAVLSVIVGGHPLTIVYGLRTNFLHFPLIFVMGRILTKEDVISFGKAF